MRLARVLHNRLKNPAKACRYVGNRVLAVLGGHSEFKKFIVLARSRTGSNLLVSYLNSHPQVLAAGEIFQNLRGRDSKKLLARVFGTQPRHIQAAGFKIFYYHPLDDKNSRVWQELLAIPGLHVIHLKRRNILRTLVSRKIADSQRVWQIRTTPKAAVKTTVISSTVEELERGFIETRSWETDAERMFAGHRLHTVFYEDLAADPHGTFRKITEFLGLVYKTPHSGLKKQNPLGLKDVLGNYDELKTAFSGSAWGSFFEG